MEHSVLAAFIFAALKHLRHVRSLVYYFFHRADNITRLVNLAKFQHDYK